VTRLFTVMVSLALLMGVGCGRPTSVSHKQFVPLDFPVNRVAVIGDSYTTGGGEGGLGPNGWTARVWQQLARQGMPITADVGAEGGAGYGTRGNRGSLFEDLTARTVKPDDELVVFFGSRNDQAVDPTQLSILAWGTLSLARRTAPSAKLLVIGPPWPTPDPPPEILRIRDVLNYQAETVGAAFIDPIAAGWFVGQPELIAADGVHPTDAGHEYMAQKIAPLISAQMGFL
jgi:lysophospholipase L1-like esterase